MVMKFRNNKPNILVTEVGPSNPVFHRRHVRKSQSPATKQQIDDEYDQQNTADTDAAAIPPPVIAEPTPEEEDSNG